MMSHAGKALFCWAGALLLCAGPNARAQAEAVDNNYETIITNRNIFALRAPPPPQENNKPPPPPVPKVFLTGITTILGEPLALLKCTPPAAKGEQTKEKCYTLSIGQREDEIEVKTIDITRGMVQIDDYGVITNLTFDKDAPKGGGGGGGSPPPPARPMPPGPSPFNPGVRPGGLQRTLRIPTIGNGAGPRGGVSMSGATATPASYNGGGVATGGGPTMNIGGTALSMTGAPQQSGQPIIAGQDLQGGDMQEEAYAALLEAQRQVTAPDVQSGKLAPLPVTRYTPPGALGTVSEENPDAAASTATTTPTTSPTYTLPLPGGRHPLPY